MSKLKVQKVREIDDRTLPVFAELDEWMERVSKRAFDLFATRGFADGRDFDDWLMAERQMCRPAAELSERGDDFVLTIALAGFKPSELAVTANPREIIVKAARKPKKRDKTEKVRWSELRGDNVYRRIELPARIDVDEISAKFDDGLLRIKAPKESHGDEPDEQIEISSAA